MFVLDRIRMLDLTEEKFEYPQGFDLDRFMGDSFKVMRDEMFTVKVRISAEWSRWAGEKVWHESQKSRRMEDGGLELTFRVAGLDEIKMWVLSLGKEAYVVEPAALREMVLTSYREAAARYARKTEPARAGLESRERSRG
jgi:predicted DNA-binding transcriptional regulator YafY